MYFSVILLYIVVFWRATSLLALGYYVLPSFINKGFIIIIIIIIIDDLLFVPCSWKTEYKLLTKNFFFSFQNICPTAPQACSRWYRPTVWLVYMVIRFHMKVRKSVVVFSGQYN